MKIIKDKLQNAQRLVIQAHKDTEDTFLYCISDFTLIYTSGRDAFNEEYCKENNIPIITLPFSGGVMVVEPNDIQTAFVVNNGFDVGEKYLKFYKNYFEKRLPEHNVTIENNDLLIDGFKVTSYGSSDVGNKRVYTGTIFNINCNIDLIKNICLKEMNKIPKCLNEFGITTEEIEQSLLEFVNTL